MRLIGTSVSPLVLGVDDFVILNPLSGEVFRTGREEIVHLRLNEETCEIIVDDDGTLCIKSGDALLYYLQKQWRRA